MATAPSWQDDWAEHSLERRSISGSQLSPANPEEYTELFTALAERLLDGEGNDLPARRAHLLRLFSRLMPEAAPESRHVLVQRLAAMNDMPADLALVMARDRPDISAPLLKYAPFSHDELVGLIARTGAEHHAEIARRADLTLDVWLSMARAAARRTRYHAAAGQAPRADKPEPAMASHAAEDRTPPDPAVTDPAQISHPSPVDRLMEEDDLRARLSALREAAAQSGSASLESESADEAAKNPENTTSERPRSMTERAYPDAGHVLPLDDSDELNWRFETDRDGRIIRLSSNAALAFGALAPDLVGQHLAVVLQDFAASPVPDDIGADMKRRTPIRDTRVELQLPDGAPRCWRIRANPRFTFPDGRFEGYIGAALEGDINERPEDAAGAPKTAEELLTRLSMAAERLADAADTPELRDYAVTMRDYVHSLQSMAQEHGRDRLFSMPDRTRSS